MSAAAASQWRPAGSLFRGVSALEALWVDVQVCWLPAQCCALRPCSRPSSVATPPACSCPESLWGLSSWSYSLLERAGAAAPPARGVCAPRAGGRPARAWAWYAWCAVHPGRPACRPRSPAPASRHISAGAAAVYLPCPRAALQHSLLHDYCCSSTTVARRCHTVSSSGGGERPHHILRGHWNVTFNFPLGGKALGSDQCAICCCSKPRLWRTALATVEWTPGVYRRRATGATGAGSALVRSECGVRVRT